MIDIENNERRFAFARWLRTGRLPSVGEDGTELKFNPWHDPDDGRFTHAGAGRYFGPGGGKSADRRKPSLRRTPAVARPAAKPRGKPGDTPSVARSSGPLRKVAEFADGVGDGLYDVGKEAVTGLREVLTTNPVTTVRNFGQGFGQGIARTIDATVAAEDTPARIQIRRAADAAANASAHDIGYVTGRVSGNVVLAAAQGAVVTKVSAVRRAAATAPRPTYDPLTIGWTKENLGPEKVWTKYNDGATGSRPGQAPTLIRTLPDGSKRPVKFDGVEGDTLIDRKWSIHDRPRARAQLIRQSEVLAQHHAIGTLEVPNEVQKAKALKLLNKMSIKNIRVRVVLP